MNKFYGLKKRIILSSMKKKNAKHPFVEAEYESFMLPKKASSDINNSYYFAGFGANRFFLARLGERRGVPTEVWIAYKDGDVLLVDPRESYENRIPLKVKCLESGKKWSFSYSGNLLDKKSGRKYKAVFAGIFTATAPIFDFTYHNNPLTTAEAIASLKWSKAFFAELQANSQTHYEQEGSFELNVSLDGKQSLLSLKGVRDHSFGMRKWDYMNNHFWLLAVTEKGRIFNLSHVSYPGLKDLKVGYTDLNGNKWACLLKAALPSNIYNAGKGLDETHFLCQMDDGKSYEVSYHRDGAMNFSFGGKYVFSEGFGSFEVAGEKAYGIIEFGFNSDSKRWIEP